MDMKGTKRQGVCQVPIKDNCQQQVTELVLSFKKPGLNSALFT